MGLLLIYKWFNMGLSPDSNVIMSRFDLDNCGWPFPLRFNIDKIGDLSNKILLWV